MLFVPPTWNLQYNYLWDETFTEPGDSALNSLEPKANMLKSLCWGSDSVCKKTTS